MESTAAWQTATLCGIVWWIILASYLNVTQKFRSLLQPWVTRRVIAETPFILQIQVSHVFSRKKKTHIIILVQFFVFDFWFNLMGIWFWWVFFCRITSISYWMFYFLDCAALFLCLSTLLFFHCSSGCVCVCFFFSLFAMLNFDFMLSLFVIKVWI